MKTYECEGCDAVFNGTEEEAFNEGWDTPERFLSHVTCPNCPITVTAWWKAVVEKQPLTDEEAARVVLANRMHDEDPKTPEEFRQRLRREDEL